MPKQRNCANTHTRLIVLTFAPNEPAIAMARAFNMCPVSDNDSSIFSGSFLK